MVVHFSESSAESGAKMIVSGADASFRDGRVMIADFALSDQRDGRSNMVNKTRMTAKCYQHEAVVGRGTFNSVLKLYHLPTQKVNRRTEDGKQGTDN